jgi:hypothetical protein
VTGSPTGNTYFDSVQMKVTKRMSKGLQANLSYTFSKALTSTRQDIFNPASSTKSIQSTDQPHVLAINFLYQTQTYFTNHLAALITAGFRAGQTEWRLTCATWPPSDHNRDQFIPAGIF